MKLSTLALVIGLCIPGFADPDPAVKDAPLDGGDRTEELRKHLLKGFESKRSGDKEAWLEFRRGFVMPDAGTWFRKVFGEETGAKLASDYAKQVDKIPDYVDYRCEVPREGELSIKITRICSDNSEGSRFDRSIVRAMRTRESLYRVEADSEAAGPWMFMKLVYANGGFRLPDVLDGAMAPVDLCAVRLTQIGVYLALFEMKFARYPLDFSEIKRPDMLTDDRLLQCPCQEGAETGFQYFYPYQEQSTPGNTYVAWDLKCHEGDLRNVLTFKGKVELVPEKEFQEVLARQRKASVEGLKKSLETNESWTVSVKEKSPPRDKRKSVLEELLKSCEAEDSK